MKTTLAFNELIGFYVLKKEVSTSSFFPSRFNYCPLVWMLVTEKSVHKIEAIRKKALRCRLNDYENLLKVLL